MEIIPENMNEFKQLLQQGGIQKAYRGLMDYILSLRTYLMKKYPDHAVSALYPGYMDMTYFAFTPRSLQARRLKIAIVFVYDTFRFEVWLSGQNKNVMAAFWERLIETGWDRYRVAPSLEGMDAIVEHVLVGDPDFSAPDALSARIEQETLAFIAEIEDFLSGIA